MKNNFAKNSTMALGAGILIAIMVTINSVLANMLGTWIAIVIVHIMGILTAGVLLLIKPEKKFVKKAPFIYFLGGIYGFLIVLLNNLCVEKIGVALTLGLALVGQIIASAFIEHFGILGVVKKKITLKKLPAYLLMIIGAILMILEA